MYILFTLITVSGLPLAKRRTSVYKNIQVWFKFGCIKLQSDQRNLNCFTFIPGLHRGSFCFSPRLLCSDPCPFFELQKWFLFTWNSYNHIHLFISSYIWIYQLTLWSVYQFFWQIDHNFSVYPFIINELIQLPTALPIKY